MSDVMTGEAVPLELRRASVPTRLLAGGIDLVLQFGTVYALVLIITLIGAGSDGGSGMTTSIAAAVSIVLVVLVFVGYPVVMETLTRGRTLGKMALGIRVVRVDGGPIMFRQALVRGLLAALLEKPGLLFGLTIWVGVLAMIVNTDSRRIGDLAAGTMVIRDRVPSTAPRSDIVAMPPQLAGWAALLDLGRLDDGLALSARQYLARRAELTSAAADTLGRELADAVAAATTPPPPVGTPPWAYLSAVLAERRRRATPAPFQPAAQPVPSSSPSQSRLPAQQWTGSLPNTAPTSEPTPVPVQQPVPAVEPKQPMDGPFAPPR